MKPIDKELDRLWSEIIRKRGKCERCGRTDRLQAAHIISRSHRNTRWDLMNGLCLCGGCHIFFAHKEPLEFAEFVKKKLGKKEYDNLRARGQMVVKNQDKEAIKMYLKKEYEKL